MLRNRKDFQQAVEGYFAACDEKTEKAPPKGASPRQIPYTLHGLSSALGLQAGELLQLTREGNSWQRPILNRAISRIAAYTMERALLGELSYQMATLALKELEPDKGPDKRLSVVMEGAAEAYSL